MNDYRMTSDPTAAISVEGVEQVQALKFANRYRSENMHTMKVRVLDSEYGTNLVHLSTFSGSLWVAKI